MILGKRGEWDRAKKLARNEVGTWESRRTLLNRHLADQNT